MYIRLSQILKTNYYFFLNKHRDKNSPNDNKREMHGQMKECREKKKKRIHLK